jgi:hypothetical protein
LAGVSGKRERKRTRWRERDRRREWRRTDMTTFAMSERKAIIVSRDVWTCAARFLTSFPFIHQPCELLSRLDEFL